jgi:hypothetical protein
MSSRVVVVVVVVIVVASIIIIIVVVIISFMQGIHTYIPETNHVSRVYSRSYSVRTVNGACNAVFNIKLFCASTLALSAVCVLCPIWLFSVVP